MATNSLKPTTLSRFDRTVGLAMLVITALIGLVIWRGDQIQLRIVAITPGPDAANVSTRTHVQIRFDQPLDPPTTKDVLFFIPPLAGTVRVDNHTLTFVPTAPLQPNTEYQATLNPGLLGHLGGELRAAERWRFRTGGVQVAYSTIDEAGKEQLFLTPAQFDATATITATPLQLTQLNNSLWEFAVAPDGSQIVFSALKEDGTSDLWRISPGEQAPSLLLACPNAVCSSVAWSADGQVLAFSRRNATQFSAPALSPPRLWLLDVASGESFPAFTDDQKLAFEPRWSADSQWLSYVSPDLGGIGVYNLQTNAEQFYPSTSGEAAVWHPQRNVVVFGVPETIKGSYITHLRLVDPVTQGQTKLSGAAELVEDGSPAWSPDGEWLAFRRKEFTGPGATPGKQLWLMDQEGRDAKALTADPAFDFGPPLWSPDGRYLLFHKLPLKGPDIVLSVWLMDVETGRTWQIANPGQRPQWFP
jgi:Tol biopolymer transport system component